jgi:hypothetical protein
MRFGIVATAAALAAHVSNKALEIAMVMVMRRSASEHSNANDEQY